MTEIHLQRRESCRNKSPVCAPDWELFLHVRPELNAVLRECLGVATHKGFHPNRSYLGLIVDSAEPALIPAVPRTAEFECGLTQLYQELRSVCDAIESCEIDPDSGCIRLPGIKLPLLERAQYRNVFELLDKLSWAQGPSIAPLTWMINGEVKVLKVGSTARVRAAKAQAILASEGPAKNPESSQSIDDQPSGEPIGAENQNDDEERTTGEPTSSRMPKSFIVDEVLGDSVFRDATGKIIALRNSRLPDVQPGDTVHLYDYVELGGGGFEMYDVERAEVSRQRLPNLL